MLPGASAPPRGSELVDWTTVVIPDRDAAKTLADAALVDVLRAHTAAQPRRLGYLETGVAGLVVPTAPRVTAYVGWPYVLLEGGPEQAAANRSNRDATPWHSALPELLFRRDRSWLAGLHPVGRRPRRTRRPGRGAAPAP